MKVFKEFRSFAIKGNVLDLAVAVIIGAAFGKIVSSLVTDIIMPPLGFIIGNVDFRDLKWIIQEGAPAVMNGDTVVSPAIQEVTLNYGMFVQNIFDFLIIAFAVFMVVKGANRLKKKEEEAPAEPSKPSNEEVLLAEIRDLLKEKK